MLSVFIIDLWRNTELEENYIIAEAEETNVFTLVKRKKFLNTIGIARNGSFSKPPRIHQNTVNLWALHKIVEKTGGYVEVNTKSYIY